MRGRGGPQRGRGGRGELVFYLREGEMRGRGGPQRGRGGRGELVFYLREGVR